MGPVVPKGTGAAPTEWVHGTVWKKSEKSAGATKTKARLMIDRAPLDNLYLLSMRVAGRPHSHPLPLPLCLGIPLQALHGDGNVHQCPEGLIVCRVQLLLKDGRETTKEAVLLLAVGVH